MNNDHKQNITTAATQSPRHFLGGTAVISISGTWGSTTATLEINFDSSDGASGNWVPITDQDGAISLTADAGFSLRNLPQCSIRCITTGGTPDLDFILRVGKY